MPIAARSAWIAWAISLLGEFEIVVHRDREAACQARLGQQLLGLRDILPERVVLQRAGQRIGQEGLADTPGVRRDVLGDRVVVDRPLDRLMHLHLREFRRRLVHRDVHRRALWRRRDRIVLVAADRLELVGTQIARDIDVALLQHQQLRRRIGDVPQHDPAHQGLFGVVRVDVDDHVVARRPIRSACKAPHRRCGSSARRCQDRRWSGWPSPSSCPPRCRHWPSGSTARSWWPAPAAASSRACSRPGRGSSSRRCRR